MASLGKSYLFEVLLYKIKFQSDYENIPNKNDISFNVRFSEIINTDIIVSNFMLPSDELKDEVLGPVLTINVGQTCFFIHDPKDLITALRENPLELGLQVNRQTIATALIPFKSEFADMVNIFESIGVVKSVEYNGDSDLKTTSDENIATMKLFFRLSCFGDTIYTDFRWLEVNNEYIFMDPKTTRLFKFENYDLTRADQITPLVSIYNPAINTPTSNITKTFSWTELFGGGAEVKLSVAPIGVDECPIQMDFGVNRTISMVSSGFDIVSMIFRPPENKFFDFLNMVSAEVTTKEDETTVTLSVSTEKPRIDEDYSEKIQDIIGLEDESQEGDELELTADRIAKRLCKNKDCPAAKKFKEYGIGPLATGKGLGTMYGNVEPPCTYGLSHTYGTLANYGPYGVFSRPKSPDQPFVPPKNAVETSVPPQRKEKTCGRSTRKLRCGKNLDASKRLRGGGPLENESCQGPKSPFLECKPIMDQFDQILAAYKKALGPCGQAICPYNQNVAAANCGQSCPVQENIDRASCQSVPCNYEECPYTENKNRFPAGCGSPKCAYTAYKLGLVDDDAAIELQFLPPAISGKCGHPKCEYPLKPDLPPIHWDCPDPLPKGNCKNLNCPLQPPDLKKMKCRIPKRGPCGSTDCPYALPSPCDIPSCPFRQNPCPFLQQQQGDAEASCSMKSQEEEICENPECPFASNTDDQSGCLQEENLKGEFVTCANPECPFLEKAKKGKGKEDEACSNVKCPAKSTKTCGAPRKSKKKSTSAQKKDADCPFAAKSTKTKSVCNNPKCPFASETSTESDLCPNPDCSFAKKSSNSDSEKCSNPSADCESGSVCSNASCPYTDTETNPVCTDAFCPYAQPLPSCGIPNCPFEPVPVVYCPSPYCPAKPKVQQRKARRSSDQKQKQEVNGGEEAVVAGNGEIILETETTVVSKVVDDGVKEQKEALKENGKGKKKRGKFVYSIGNKYPGVKIGHRECVTPMFNVPPKMGWLWNIHTPILRMKPRKGWKPGAIVKTIAHRIRAHRQLKGLGMLHVPKFRKNKDGNQSDTDVNVSPKPTLHIQKKDGAYLITMNPLKDPKSLVENEDPYMECTPMQFKITKSRNKERGEDAEDDSKLCCCESEEETSSSDSELDIEFTPPAGIIHPERFKKKKNVIHCDTQYDPNDFEVKKVKDKPKSESGRKGKGKGKDKGKEKGKGKGKKGKK